MNTVEWIFQSSDKMLEGAQIDYVSLKTVPMDENFFKNYDNIRIVNSFLFNFSKLQDKIGAKLFRTVLYEMKEIDEPNLPMIDILNLLEKLGILESAQEWEKLREIRNLLAHEYPFDEKERIENVQLALQGYESLKAIYERLKAFYSQKNKGA